MLSAGRHLLSARCIDKYDSLRFIANYLSHRDQTLEMASHFLTKSLLVFKVCTCNCVCMCVFVCVCVACLSFC
jgi:hypothetical protein